MNGWTWAHIGKPVWLMLKRRGLNKDLRNLFMKRYSQLMNECVLARHTELLERAIAPMRYDKMSPGTIMTLLNDMHYDVCLSIVVSIHHQIPVPKGVAGAWFDPDRAWQRKQEYAKRVLDTWEGFDDEK
jgi:hypothetical protein